MTCHRRHPTTPNQTKKMDNEQKAILNHRNWTGHTLEQLVTMGRANPDEKTIAKWADAALGPVNSIPEFLTRQKICKEIASLTAKTN